MISIRRASILAAVALAAAGLGSRPALAQLGRPAASPKPFGTLLGLGAPSVVSVTPAALGGPAGRPLGTPASSGFMPVGPKLGP